MKTVYVHDRDDPAAKPFVNLPVYATFCARVHANGQAVLINSATQYSDACDVQPEAAVWRITEYHYTDLTARSLARSATTIT